MRSGYRSRFQFTEGGLKEKEANNIVAIKDCLIATENVRTLLQNNKIPFTKDRLNVFENHIGNNKNNNSSQNETISVTIANKKLSFSVNGFFQSNLEMLEKTIPLVIENLEGGNLLDMYSGVGTFSIFAGEKFKHTTLVEFSKLSSSYTKENLGNIKHSMFAMTGAKWTKTKNAKTTKFDAVIIDPPRTGIEKEVLQWLIENKPQIIRSVSCDPVTHARDTKKIIEAGYVIEKMYLLDFYPQTSHIESLIHFKYKG